MKGVLILFVTTIVMCVGNRTHGIHRHRHAKTGLKPERYWEYHFKARHCQKQVVSRVWNKF